MTDRASLRDRLRARDRLHGLILKLPCLAEVEIAAGAVDLLVLDLEHGPRDDLLLVHHLRAADAAGIPVLVRVPTLDAATIGNVLDAGATGIVVPRVEDEQQAAAVVQAARYPPDGVRGWARSTRAARYGRVGAEEHLARARDTCVVVQVESVAAAGRAHAIGQVPGVDGLFPGAADIAADAGHAGKEATPTVVGAVDEVFDAAKDLGRSAMAVAGDRSAAQLLRGRGATTTLAVATSLIASAFDDAASWTRETQVGRVEPGPLLLIAGMLETAAVWSGWLDLLEPGWHPHPARVDLDDSIGEMAASALAAAPSEFVLVGHSLGALVALEMLALAPARVRGAVLVSSPARAPTDGQLAAWSDLESRVTAGGFAAIAEAQPDLVLGAVHRADPAKRRIVEAMARRLGPDGFSTQLRAQHGRRDMRGDLHQITCPVLVLSGTDDAICPPDHQAEIADLVRDAQHVTIDGVGHTLPLEDPVSLQHAFAAWARAKSFSPGAYAPR